jgi:hypothetical protein
MDGGIMHDMLISSDTGLTYGNIVITPSELAKRIVGIDIVNGLLEIEGVKFVNRNDRQYILDQDGTRHQLEDLMEAA